MKIDNDYYKDIEKDIVTGQAVIIREAEKSGDKVQYIARIIYDKIIITMWKYSQ